MIIKLFVLITSFILLNCNGKKELVIHLDEKVLYANKMSQALLSIYEKQGSAKVLSKKKYKIRIQPDELDIIGDKSGIIEKGKELILISSYHTGSYRIQVDVENEKSIIFHLDLIEDDRDEDGDGFPDIAELKSEKDRKAFREWFSQLAESQYYFENNRLSEDNRDCSGLARFSYAEALKKHDKKWKRNWKHLFDFAIPDVERFQYPDIPLLKNKLFRIRSGVFQKSDIEAGVFSSFAESQYLMKYNCKFISKDLSQAQKGDLLFFKNTRDYHLMIYIGKSRLEIEKQRYAKGPEAKSDNKENYLVYHTGPIENGKGEMRKVKIDILLNHPNPVWRPIDINPNFLGVYRWNILN